MSIYVTVPIKTEVIESNPDCKIIGNYEDGKLVITIDTRNQNSHQRLGVGTKTQLYWGKEHSYEVQELSAMLWPIRYRVLSREGYYIDEQGQRVHFTTKANGIDEHKLVSKVLMRAAIMLLVIGAIGYRRAAWLLEVLFHVNITKSSLHRWVESVASQLPSGDEIIRLLNEKKPVTEGHLDEIFPLGMNHCVLVLKDEHGRILATKKVEKRNEGSVRPLLKRIKDLGLPIKSFYTDGYKAYYNAIREVFGKAVTIQMDYFHIIQNIWRITWKWFIEYRRGLKERIENSKTVWYKKKLEALAKSLWKNRYVLFKSEKNMTEEEKRCLTEMMEGDQRIGRLRSFLKGVWHIFEDSKDEREARVAIEALKQKTIDRQNPKSCKKVIKYLETHFSWMTTFLSHPNVRRNSLSETSMRTLRRLEISHDGFRSDRGRENFLRIYQAIKYLDWNVYKPPNDLLKIK